MRPGAQDGADGVFQTVALGIFNTAMELEREQLRKTYQSGLLAFGLLSLALSLALFTCVVPLLAHFGGAMLAFYLWLYQSSWYGWIDVPIVWGSLLGTTLLWGRWEHVGWQRRVGLLMMMCLADSALWFLDHGVDLGIKNVPAGHPWLRHNIGQALGWAEFALLATLSCDYLEHLGVEHARDASKSARAMAATGAMLWMLLLWENTDWSRWPLRPRPPSADILLLLLGSHLIWSITLAQVTGLTIAATRKSREALAEMALEDVENDPLRPPHADFQDRFDESRELHDIWR